MALLSSLCEFGKKMPEFVLKDLNDKSFNSKNLENYDGILIFFICNHCPYVKAIIKKLVITALDLKKYNVISIAIMPNDTIRYPEDNFENMKKFSKINNFPFPYLIDHDQDIAKKFNAVCTPDFLDTIKKELQYRGRLFELKNLEIINDKNELLDNATYSKDCNGPKSNFQALDEIN